MSQPRITCGPIELRLPEPDDATELYELARDPELTRYLQWPPHASTRDSLAYIDDAQRLWERRVAFLPCIYRSSDGALVGATGLSHFDRVNRRAEVGTWIGIPFQRSGYNRPAKAALFRYAFEVLDMARLELFVKVANERSARSTRRLPGVTGEGIARQRLWKGGIGHDAHVFALLAGEYDPADWPAVTLPPGLA